MSTRYASGRRAGIVEGLVSQLLDYEHGDFSAREKAALRYADEIFLDYQRVTCGVVERVREHFTEPELVELTWAICVWIETGRMFHALDVPYGDAESEQNHG